MTGHAPSSTGSATAWQARPPHSDWRLIAPEHVDDYRAKDWEVRRVLDVAQRPVARGETDQLQARKNVSFDIASDINGLMDDYISIPSAEALRRSDAEAALRGALWDNKAGIVSLLMAFAKEPTQGGDKGEAVAWANRDELDNMLDDRAAVVTGKPDGWRRTPLYAAPQPVSNAGGIDRGELILFLHDLASPNLTKEAAERQASRMADALIAKGIGGNAYAAKEPGLGEKSPQDLAEIAPSKLTIPTPIAERRALKNKVLDFIAENQGIFDGRFNEYELIRIIEVFEEVTDRECLEHKQADHQSDLPIGNAEDIRWAVSVLLEKIAEKFEGWDTLDLWRSEAASTVRSFKHDLASPSVPTDDVRGRGEMSDPTIQDRLTNIMTWLREPDWIEDATQEWLMDWMNRRPIAELAMVAMLMPSEIPPAKSGGAA